MARDTPLEWKMIDRLKPVDLSNIADKGMKGAVMLAVAMGWNLIQREGQPAQLVSREGLRRNIPTDTGVRQSVFWSQIASILSHSDGNLPTPELIEQIVKQTGMSRAHAHVLKSRTALIAAGTDVDPDDQPDEEELGNEGEQAEDEAEDTDDPIVVDVITLPETPSATALEAPFSERVEPTLNHAGDGAQYISPVMETVIRQLVEDGDDQITYRCKQCGLEFETKRGVGAHWQRHVQAGEAEATALLTKTIVNVVPDYVPTEVHNPREGSSLSELRRLRKIVRDVQLAVGQDALKEYEARAFAQQRRIDALQKERDDAIKRADRLASDLQPGLPERITFGWAVVATTPVPKELTVTIVREVERRTGFFFLGDTGLPDRSPAATVTVAVTDKRATP